MLTLRTTFEVMTPNLNSKYHDFDHILQSLILLRRHLDAPKGLGAH